MRFSFCRRLARLSLAAGFLLAAGCVMTDPGPQRPGACTSDADCDDDDPCTQDVCDAEGECSNPPVECPSGQTCNPITGDCVFELLCENDDDCPDDVNTCTVPVCSEDGVCGFAAVADGTLCDDGNPCTENEVCTDGVCEGASIPGCCVSDGDCFAGETCDLDTNECVQAADCAVDADCNDGNLCTDDACDPLSGCRHTPVNCPRGMVCALATGNCVAVTTPDCTTNADCNDGNPCTQDNCGTNNTCSNPPVECPADEACNQQTGECQPVAPPQCGNGILDPGEQCDPPDGATCDQNCQILVQAADSCTTPTPVVDAQREFTNVGATSDGPDEPEMCTFFGRSDILSDVWFCYTASCTGEAVVSLCGSRYDTKMAVYSGCECPTEIPIACSDDDCGVAGFDSRVTFQATAGESFLIRIGGFAGDQGDGILSIRCGADVCSPDSGECFVANSTPGCSTRTCCQTTCDADPFCCDVAWDDFCAGEAVGLCTGSFPVCEAGTGDCLSANGTPGCNITSCCNQVCQIDPFCCLDNWDDLCAEQAGVCALTCGTGESCSTVQSTPGCSDAACCQTVCQEDPFCCSGAWDEDCVAQADEFCP